MEDFITQNALLGLVAAMIMQGIKKSGLPFLQVPNGDTDKLHEWVNRIFSVAMAAMFALGIHYTFHFDSVTGAYDFHFAGTLSGLKEGLWEVTKQWAAQHGMYKLVVSMPEVMGNILQTNSSLLDFVAAQKPAQEVSPVTHTSSSLASTTIHIEGSNK